MAITEIQLEGLRVWVWKEICAVCNAYLAEKERPESLRRPGDNPR